MINAVLISLVLTVNVPDVYAGASLAMMEMLTDAERTVNAESNIFGYPLNDDEVLLCKLVAMAEAGETESIDGIERVLNVIANRCRSDRFPDTVTEVLFQKNQFETVRNGRIWRYAVNERVEEAWGNLIDRGRCADEEILYFGSEGYEPSSIPMYKLGNHYFGR